MRAVNQYYRALSRGGVAPLVDYTTYELLYSVARRLNTSYTGALFRVKRDSDAVEQDISYLPGNEMDSAALAAFCSGTIGRIQTVYNQGLSGATFDVVYYVGTRSIIYQSGAVELVNGKASMLGQTDNGYRTSACIAISDSKLDAYNFQSAVFRTASSSNYGVILGEIGNATGNNRKGLLADTTTSRRIFENVVTSAGGSTDHLVPVQATQNQQRQYSFFHFNIAFSSVPSKSYWNVALQQQRNFLRWGTNTAFQFYLMRYGSFTFLGSFQEYALKLTDGGTDETELDALRLEQNIYYSIY